jgi:hypothetical protein
MASSSPLTAVEPPLDDLARLQLRVARRADEIARTHRSRYLNVHCWLLAEAEVLRSTEFFAEFGPPPVAFLRAS